MSRPFDLRLPLEHAYTRNAMLAVDVLDAVSLGRLTQGVTVTAKGLVGKPIVNHSGLFVWLKEGPARFEKLIVDPGTLPYQSVEISAVNVTSPVHVVALNPLPSYPFAPGTTALRGALIETAVPVGTAPTPVVKATIRLEWLDDDAVTWHPAPDRFITNAWGQFAAFLRLFPTDSPQLDAGGNLTIRLLAKREAAGEKHKQFLYPQGRVVDETYAWDSFQP